MLYSNVPMTPSGVGFDSPTRWVYTHYDGLLNVYGIKNHISMTFNLKSPDDIEKKLEVLYNLRDNNPFINDDIQELEERLRTLCDFEVGGYGDQTLAGIRESKNYKKGQKYFTYTDGKKVEHIARGKRKVVSQATKDACATARQYAHTPEAENKRRKSISAKGDEKALDSVVESKISAIRK